MSLHITLGYKKPHGKGEPECLYAGADAEKAKSFIVSDKFKSVRIISQAYGYVKQTMTTAEAKRQAEEKAKAKAKAEAEAKAKAEAEAKAEAKPAVEAEAKPKASNPFEE